MSRTVVSDKQAGEPKRILRSLQQSLDLLDVLATSDATLGTTDLASAVGLSKAGVHAMLTNLEARGYVARATDGVTFRLGSRLWELGQRAGRGDTVVDASRPSLLDLTGATGENSHVATYGRGGTILFLDRIHTAHPVQAMIVPVGQRAPASTTALGHVLLAFQDNAEIDAVCGHGMQAMTRFTITDEAALREALGDVRATGFAVRRGLHHEDVVAIAAPVRDGAGTVSAGIGVFGPAYRFGPDEVANMLPHVLAAAATVSRKLGWREGSAVEAAPPSRTAARGSVHRARGRT